MADNLTAIRRPRWARQYNASIECVPDSITHPMNGEYALTGMYPRKIPIRKVNGQDLARVVLKSCGRTAASCSLNSYLTLNFHFKLMGNTNVLSGPSNLPAKRVSNGLHTWCGFETSTPPDVGRIRGQVLRLDQRVVDLLVVGAEQQRAPARSEATARLSTSPHPAVTS